MRNRRSGPPELSHTYFYTAHPTAAKIPPWAGVASIWLGCSDTVALDEHEQPAPTAPRLLHRPGESERRGPAPAGVLHECSSQVPVTESSLTGMYP